MSKIKLSKEFIKNTVKLALNEDLYPSGDITSSLIKDDKIVMYGFTSLSDQNIFKLLQSVQGVGPKAAISILSTLSVEEIVLAISSGDKAMIARADGIGPKVAGRVTLELLEKVSSFNLSKANNVFDKNERREHPFRAESSQNEMVKMVFRCARTHSVFFVVLYHLEYYGPNVFLHSRLYQLVLLPHKTHYLGKLVETLLTNFVHSRGELMPQFAFS